MVCLQIFHYSHLSLAFLLEKMCSLIYSCLVKTEMQPQHQSDQNTLWLLSLLTLVPIAYYVLLHAAVLLKIKWANVSSEVLFVLTVGAEAFVRMRSQFPHTNKVMLIHACCCNFGNFCWGYDLSRT